MVQCRCTQVFIVISRYDGGLALERRRNKARLVTDSRCTGKWRKEHTVYRFTDKYLLIITDRLDTSKSAFGRVYQYPGHYGGHTEITEVSGTGFEFVPNHTGVFERVSRPYRKNTGTPGIVVEGIPVPRLYLGGRTELTEVSATGIEILPKLTKCRVPVLGSYRTHRRIGYRH